MTSFITPIQPMQLEGNKTTPLENSSGSMPFQNILSQAIDQTQELSAISEQDNINLISGDVDNLAQIQINSLKAKTMLQTTVQLTTRVVNAYKEIMQMQI